MKKSLIYMSGFSIILIILPLYVGFPKFTNGSFILSDHGKIRQVSELYYIFSRVIYVLSALGLLSFSGSFLILQKKAGYKPSLIPTRIELDFLKQLYVQIKSDFISITIFIGAIIAIILGVFESGI